LQGESAISLCADGGRRQVKKTRKEVMGDIRRRQTISYFGQSGVAIRKMGGRFSYSFDLRGFERHGSES